MKQLIIILFWILALAACKKDEEIPSEQVSISRPVDQWMLNYIKGQWSRCSDGTNKMILNVINDSVLYLSPTYMQPSDTFKYEVRQYTAVNSFYLRRDSIAFDVFFLIKEDESFWFVPNDKLCRK